MKIISIDLVNTQICYEISFRGQVAWYLFKLSYHFELSLHFEWSFFKLLLT